MPVPADALKMIIPTRDAYYGNAVISAGQKGINVSGIVYPHNARTFPSGVVNTWAEKYNNRFDDPAYYTA